MRNVVILNVVLFHLVAGLVASFFSADTPAVSSAILFGFILAQTSLLGMWSGLSTTKLAHRLVGLIAGSAYLSRLFQRGIDDSSVEVFVLVAVPSVLVAAVSGTLRRFKGSLTRMHEGDSKPHDGLQFGIRHLMLLTLVVACLMTSAKLLAPSLSRLGVLLRVAVLALCYTVVAVASVWAMLGAGSPRIRSVFVILVAGLAGLVGNVVIGDGDELPFWLATMGIQALLLLGSLEVVRIAGFRFASRSLPPPSGDRR